MSKLLQIEFAKIKKSLAFKITLIICALMCLMTVAIYTVVSNVSEFDVLGISITGYDMFITCVTDSSDVLMLVTIVTCIMIGGDFSARTLQGQIVAGYSRTKIIISRLISSFVLMFVFSLVYTLIISGGITLLVGFGKEFTAKVAGEMILSYIMSLFMSYAIMTLYLLIIFIFKSVGPSLGITMPIMLVGTSIIQMLGIVSEMAEKIISFTPYGQLLVIGDFTLKGLDYVKFFTVGIVYMAVIVAIMIFTFRKAELK